MSKKKILITGASSDLGLALMKDIASPEKTILAHYNSSKDRILQLKEENPGVELIPLQADFRKTEEVERFVQTVASEFGTPDQIVHLPGGKFRYIRFKDLSWEDIQTELDIQFKSVFHILQRFLPDMAKAKTGKVVVVLSSVVMNVPPKALTHYITTKYALLGLMKALAAEYADRGICINAISPSMIETQFLSELPGTMVELVANQHPLKRNAIPGDIVPMIRFLLSSESNFINGTNMPVTGGQTF